MSKKILPYLLILILLTISITATRYINYEIYEGIIDQNGNFTPTTNPINDSYAIGFVCSSANCTTVSATLWNGAVQSTGPVNTLQLTYPTVLQSTYGYGVYYYKPGYITWEQNPNWWGTDPTDPQGPYSRYLSKKQGCHAPIDTFTVINDAYPNQPIQINVTASLDATTYAAIHHAGPLDYVPPALEQDYYSIATSVTLTILDENNNTVNQQIQNIIIPFSGSQRVEFTWTPTTPGTYRAIASTNVTDAKCSSSLQQSTWKDFNVLSNGPTNICYTLINDLATSDQFPYNGDTITITANKISNHADDNYQLTPIPTDITLTITNEQGGLINQQFMYMPANPDSVNSSSFGFDWTIPSPGAGYYTINVTGIANSPLCQGLENLQESEYLGLIVQGQEPEDNQTNITSLECFPYVIVNHNQSCSVYVEENNEPAGNQQVTIYYENGSVFGTCTTDSITGGCEVKDLQTQTGQFTAYASQTGFSLNNPSYTYQVLDERYDIVDLRIFNDPNFQNEDYDFYRNEDMYVSFRVRDMFNNDELVNPELTEAHLISPPGGRVELTQVTGLQEPFYYYFALTPIPPTHDFLGLSQVFAFAFNFTNQSGGQEQINLIIRNNPPQIIGTIPDIETDDVYELDLAPYEYDIEDSGSDLVWSVSGVNTNLFSATIIGKILRIASNNIGNDDIILTLTDLDGDSDSQSINVGILGQEEEQRLYNDDLSILGLKVTSNEYLRPGGVLQLSIYLENHADQDLENLKIAVVVHELGISRRNGPFDLKEGEGVNKRIFVDIPEDAVPGFYSIRITISNDQIRRVKYRDFFII